MFPNNNSWEGQCFLIIFYIYTCIIIKCRSSLNLGSDHKIFKNYCPLLFILFLIFYSSMFCKILLYKKIRSSSTHDSDPVFLFAFTKKAMLSLLLMHYSGDYFFMFTVFLISSCSLIKFIYALISQGHVWVLVTSLTTLV